jgi:radical SAM protein with 4Fe4S-binding SPASM domain
MKPILEFCDQAHQTDASFYINIRLWNLVETNLQKHQNLQVFDMINSYFKVNLNENINVKHNKSKKIQHKTYIHFDTEFVWPDLKQEIRSTTGTCYGLRKQLAVHANGDVVPCCLDKESVLKLGNLHENSIEDILNSVRAKKIKTGFERGELTEELCQKCQYAERFKK